MGGCRVCCNLDFGLACTLYEKVGSLRAERKKLWEQQHDLNVLLKQEQKKQRRLALKGRELTVDDTDVWFITVFDLSWMG